MNILENDENGSNVCGNEKAISLLIASNSLAVPAVPASDACRDFLMPVAVTKPHPANAEADLELQHAEALASMMQQLAGRKERYGEVNLKAP